MRSLITYDDADRPARAGARAPRARRCGRWSRNPERLPQWWPKVTQGRGGRRGGLDHGVGDPAREEPARRLHRARVGGARAAGLAPRDRGIALRADHERLALPTGAGAGRRRHAREARPPDPAARDSPASASSRCGWPLAGPWTGPWRGWRRSPRGTDDALVGLGRGRARPRADARCRGDARRRAGRGPVRSAASTPRWRASSSPRRGSARRPTPRWRPPPGPRRCASTPRRV